MQVALGLVEPSLVVVHDAEVAQRVPLAASIAGFAKQRQRPLKASLCVIPLPLEAIEDSKPSQRAGPTAPSPWPGAGPGERRTAAVTASRPARTTNRCRPRTARR